MKQTAVEWIGKELESYGDSQFCKIEWEQLDSLIKQAKAMEKEQMIDAWNDGYREFYDGSSTPEEYYNQTFKSE